MAEILNKTADVFCRDRIVCKYDWSVWLVESLLVRVCTTVTVSGSFDGVWVGVPPPVSLWVYLCLRVWVATEPLVQEATHCQIAIIRVQNGGRRVNIWRRSLYLSCVSWVCLELNLWVCLFLSGVPEFRHPALKVRHPALRHPALRH